MIDSKGWQIPAFLAVTQRRGNLRIIIVKYFLNEINDLLFHFWFLQQSALKREVLVSCKCLLPVIGELRSWAPEGEWGNPAVIFIPIELFVHSLQEDLILNGRSNLVLIPCMLKHRIAEVIVFFQPVKLLFKMQGMMCFSSLMLSFSFR